MRTFSRGTEDDILVNLHGGICSEHPSLSALLADAERLRTDLAAIQSRVDDLLPELRHAHNTYDNLVAREP